MPETATEQRASLPRELTDLLVELSVALHKHAMYPFQHPSLEPAIDAVLRLAGPLLEERGSLALGVARHQLIIEGVATDERHPLLRELAERLHRHQIGGITLRAGLRRAELEELLGTLAVDGEQSDDPLGLRPAEEIPSWEHARIHPLTYDELELVGEGRGERDDRERGRRAAELWVGLARAALATPDEKSPPADAERVARAIEDHDREAAYDQVVTGHLVQLADELGDARGEDAEEVRGRLARLLATLDSETLARLLEMGGEDEQRRRFAVGAAEGFEVDSVIRVVQAAARASGQTISDSLLRLLRKLANHAEEGAAEVRARAEEQLRSQVRDLIDDWSLEDPNPDEYTEALGGMAGARPHRTGGARAHAPEAERIVRMGIEIEAVGPRVRRAVNGLVREGRIGEVTEILSGAPRSSEAVRELWEMVATPGNLRSVLRDDAVDFELVDRLLDRMGSAAADPLLDILQESDVRATRRGILDRLSDLGPEVGARVLERLEDPRWYVKRNMLVLLQSLESPPPDFDPERYFEHDDSRVRREALKLLLSDPPRRSRAVVRGLGDPDDRTVQVALNAARGECPEAAVTLVLRILTDEERATTVRATAARALRSVRSPLAKERLVKVASGGRTLLGRRRLASKSPLLVEVLRTLRRTWSDDPEVKDLLERARSSGDPEVAVAAGKARG